MEPAGALLFDVCCFSLQSGIKTEQHLRPARVTPTPSAHKIRRQFVCHCLELDPSAAQHSSDPLTGVRHCLPGSLLLRADMQTNTNPAGKNTFREEHPRSCLLTVRLNSYLHCDVMQIYGYIKKGLYSQGNRVPILVLKKSAGNTHHPTSRIKKS